MILTLDIGNSQIYGGVFDKDQRLLNFRKTSAYRGSSDETGLFLKNVLRENNIDPEKIDHIAICSVVPDLVYSLNSACLKYFNKRPFVLQVGTKTGLRIKYRNPLEVGNDRIANAIAATHLYPGEDLIIVDLGTATTFCAVSRDKDYLGGTIMAGMKISIESLESKTAQLPTVEIVKPENAMGRSTVESIQAGLYYSHLGAMGEITEKITKENFSSKPKIIGTGGLAPLFKDEGLFDAIEPDLVLKGLLLALQLN